jgi:hypothetical protein
LEELMDALDFDDGWMEREPLHTHVVDATAELLFEFPPDKYDVVGSLLFHFMSCWYPAIVESRGMLVEPAVRSCSLFTAHMVDVHDMPNEMTFGCVAVLTKFTALVITKSGGRLI